MTATIVLAGAQISWAANTPDAIKEQLGKALKYKYATHSDSATLILKQVIDELKAQDAFEAPIALEARLHLAERRLYTSDDLEGASEELHQIMDAATMQQEWEILAHAQIVLAYLYELTINRTSSLEYLAQAIDLINEHQLESLYPKYLIRRATLFRKLTSNVDSVIFYADKALKNARNLHS